MPHIGTLNGPQVFRFESHAVVKGSITVYWLKQGGIVGVELLPGTNPPGDIAIPRRTDRIVFEVTPGVNSAILFILRQGGVVVEETVVVDSQFVFDVL